MSNNYPLKYYEAKISAEDFIKIISKVYGPAEQLKLEWLNNLGPDLNGILHANLTAVHRIAISEAGVRYEVNLWDFYDYDSGVAEYQKNEAEVRISKDMVPFTKDALPLSGISVNSKEVNDESMPVAAVSLHYGEYDYQVNYGAARIA